MKYESLISQMTLAEKCSLLSGRDVWHTRAIDRLNVPAITLSDGPSGLRKQEGAGDQLGLNASVKATCFPSAAAIANSWDEQLAERVGACIGAEALAQDVQVVLGPGLNVKRSPLCGRNFEYFSEDPYLAGKLAAGFIRGVQQQGVSACPKHFAANSQESHRMASDSIVDERTLREIYLTHFEIAVREGKPQTLMSSYNLVNGVRTSANYDLLTAILRDEWGFKGLVTTDWWNHASQYEEIAAGNDIKMARGNPEHTLQMIREGKLDESCVRTSVKRLLEVILRLD